jgi:uncharacterized ParB-like nuclease family protein
MTPDQVQNIPIRQIRPSRLLVLRPLGPLDFAKIAELSESMRAVGQLQPILVSERLSDGSYEVIHGNHRFEACKRLGWQTVRCYVRTRLLDVDTARFPIGDLESQVGVQINPEHFTLLTLTLKQMGFTDPVFQQLKNGQRFGLARPLTNLLEWHVRGFADGMLDSEVEISRNRIQHLTTRPGSYYLPLLRILDRNAIPFIVAGRTPPDASYIYLPKPFGKMIPLQVPTITF